MNIYEQVTSWLQTRFFESQVLFLDYWSIVHFFVGIPLGVIFKKKSNLLFFLLAFEIVENLILVPAGLASFESFGNSMTDIILTFSGALIGRLFFKRE
jgi:hypothetical protein